MWEIEKHQAYVNEKRTARAEKIAARTEKERAEAEEKRLQEEERLRLEEEERKRLADEAWSKTMDLAADAEIKSETSSVHTESTPWSATSTGTEEEERRQQEAEEAQKAKEAEEARLIALAKLVEERRTKPIKYDPPWGVLTAMNVKHGKHECWTGEEAEMIETITEHLERAVFCDWREHHLDEEALEHGPPEDLWIRMSMFTPMAKILLK